MNSSLLPCLAASLLRGVICRGDATGVYLTFDDGPDPSTTPRLLDQLDRLECKATFFINASNAENHQDIVRNAFDAGHTIASHGYGHRSLMFASKRKILNDLRRSDDVITEITGKHPRFFRPPYGRIGPALIRTARQLGLTIVLWSLDAKDYTPTNSEIITRRINGKAAGGDIILLHDKGNSAQVMIDAIPDIIRSLRDKGLNTEALDAMNLDQIRNKE